MTKQQITDEIEDIERLLAIITHQLYDIRQKLKELTK